MSDGAPHPRAQRNFTDADSRIMESGGHLLQGHNAQIVVDDHSQVVIAADRISGTDTVTNQAPDAGHLVPMLQVAVNNCGAAPLRLSADSGYWTPTAPEACAHLGAEVFVATERHKHWEANTQVTTGPPPDDAPARDKMRWKVRSADGRALYSRRKVIVEPVFGQIKPQVSG